MAEKRKGIDLGSAMNAMSSIAQRVQMGQVNNKGNRGNGPGSPSGKVAVNTDDMNTLLAAVNKYTRIDEHGKCIWVTSDIKDRLDELKFRSGNKIGYRAFANAALEFALDKFGAELAKRFKTEK